MSDPLDLVGQEEAAKESEAQRQARRITEQADVKWLMGNARGRRFVWRLLSLAGVFRNPFAGDRQQTDFNCGLQAIGQSVLAEVNAVCPKRYHEMVRERQNDGSDGDSNGSPGA